MELISHIEFIANESKNNVEQSKIPQGGEELIMSNEEFDWDNVEKNVSENENKNNEKLGWNNIKENISEPASTQPIYQNEDYNTPNYNEENLNGDGFKKDNLEHNNMEVAPEVNNESQPVENPVNNNSDNWNYIQNENFTSN